MWGDVFPTWGIDVGIVTEMAVGIGGEERGQTKALRDKRAPPRFARKCEIAPHQLCIGSTTGKRGLAKGRDI
jgi:hypothetical protein